MKGTTTKQYYYIVLYSKFVRCCCLKIIPKVVSDMLILDLILSDQFVSAPPSENCKACKGHLINMFLNDMVNNTWQTTMCVSRRLHQ